MKNPSLIKSPLSSLPCKGKWHSVLAQFFSCSVPLRTDVLSLQLTEDNMKASEMIRLLQTCMCAMFTLLLRPVKCVKSP